jgi:hypothetical protein
MFGTQPKRKFSVKKKLIKGQPLLKQCDEVNETQKHVTTFLQRPLCTISSKPVTEEV